MNRIRDIREGADIKQSALCGVLGWRQSRLSNYETGTRIPGLDEARQIVSALNELGAACGLDDVFPDESTPADGEAAA